MKLYYLSLLIRLSHTSIFCGRITLPSEEELQARFEKEHISIFLEGSNLSNLANQEGDASELRQKAELFLEESKERFLASFKPDDFPDSSKELEEQKNRAVCTKLVDTYFRPRLLKALFQDTPSVLEQF